MRTLLLVTGSAVALFATGAAKAQAISPDPLVKSRAGHILVVEGRHFRDLDHNGVLTPYEDWRLSPEDRARDLVGRMTLEEKAGAMMHGTLPSTAPGPAGLLGVPGPAYDMGRARELIADRHINSLLTRQTWDTRDFATRNNDVQALAEATRLGIPVSISTDPRNHFQHVLGASAAAGGFSQWPDTLGFAALGDVEGVRRFGDIARQEYRAVGIHQALSPQADLATEPRWPRGSGTFGSTSATAGPLIRAYVEGFQGSETSLASAGVLTIVKHWVGYGAQPNGYDGHNYYGRIARLDRASFDEHVKAFDGAFQAGAGGIMPTYTITEGVTLDGRPLAHVGAGFSRQLLTDLLRDRLKFDGLIVSDWAIMDDCPVACRSPTADAPQTFNEIGMPWGMEDRTRQERFETGLAAGLDQFGGNDEPQYLVTAVREGRATESRLDRSVQRILVAKFRQGLFEDPFVDPDQAVGVVTNPAHQAVADDIQRRSQVLLENRGEHLPLAAGTRVYLHGMNVDAANAVGLTPVDRIQDAQVAIIRMSTPHEVLHPYNFFGPRQNEGRLDFRPGDADYDALVAVSGRLPVVAAVYMDRPAILTNVKPLADAILVNFGATDAAVLAVVTGKARPEGRLPMELPSSMAEVSAQDPAKADDTAHPLYPVGYRIALPPAAIAAVVGGASGTTPEPR
jgi:beta-glucosidase